MAGDWIKLEMTTPDKPEIHMIAVSLSVSPEQVLGGLCRIWIWADEQSIAGNAVSVTENTLDHISRVTGLAKAMREVKWLHGENGALTLPNFDRHNGQTAKKRALTARRVATHKQRIANAGDVTSALPREEKKLTTKPKPTPTPPALPDWVPGNEWAAFAESRKRLRRPMTDRARTLVIAELQKLRDQGHDPATVLSQSVRKGWLDVFPIRGKEPAGGNPLYRREGVM